MVATGSRAQAQVRDSGNPEKVLTEAGAADRREAGFLRITLKGSVKQSPGASPGQGSSHEDQAFQGSGLQTALPEHELAKTAWERRGVQRAPGVTRSGTRPPVSCLKRVFHGNRIPQ